MVKYIYNIELLILQSKQFLISIKHIDSVYFDLYLSDLNL